MKLIPVLFSFYCCCLLIACRTLYKADPQKAAATRLAITPPDTLIQKQQKGVDFFADGNDPVPWTLELDLEKGFFFKPSDGRLLLAAPVQSSRLITTGADTYLTKTDLGPMKVIVYDEICSNNDKGKRQTKKTVVTLNDKRYSGCGSYLYDHLINDIWTLQYIDNREPESADYKKQLPWLEFDLETNKMHGYDGCNNINSDIKIEGNRIKFSPFAGTKMSCSNNKTERIFSTMISDHIVDYTIKDGRLTLMLINDSRMEFTKKE